MSRNKAFCLCFRTQHLTGKKKLLPLQRVFHSIRFKVNKGWGKALPLFLCPDLNQCLIFTDFFMEYFC